MYSRFHYCLEQHRYEEGKRIRNHVYRVSRKRFAFFFSFSFCRSFFGRKMVNRPGKKATTFVGENSS